MKMAYSLECATEIFKATKPGDPVYEFMVGRQVQESRVGLEELSQELSEVLPVHFATGRFNRARDGVLLLQDVVRMGVRSPIADLYQRIAQVYTDRKPVAMFLRCSDKGHPNIVIHGFHRARFPYDPETLTFFVYDNGFPVVVEYRRTFIPLLLDRMGGFDASRHLPAPVLTDTWDPRTVPIPEQAERARMTLRSLGRRPLWEKVLRNLSDTELVDTAVKLWLASDAYKRDYLVA